MREEELISRYGGDEFVALLAMLREPAREVAAFIERMRHTLAEPLRIDAGAVQVGASLGASRLPARRLAPPSSSCATRTPPCSR